MLSFSPPVTGAYGAGAFAHMAAAAAAAGHMPPSAFSMLGGAHPLAGFPPGALPYGGLGGMPDLSASAAGTCFIYVIYS